MGLASVMASFPTIILNGSVILAIKRIKELQKPSHIMLSSLAVTDLLVGVIVMPTSAIVDFFTFREVSFRVYMYVIFGESFFLPFTLQCYYASLDHHCLGEIRGDTKLEGLQEYHHDWPP